MAIQLKNTSDVGASSIKFLVYGQSGAGKTTLAATLPNPVILSAEGGLLSIQQANLPYIEIDSMASLQEAYMWLVQSDEAKGFESLALDSISEIAEVVLAKELDENKDGRAAYGNMNQQMTSIMKSFRDLQGKHVLMTAKLDKTQDEMGRMLYAPAMPGKKMTQEIPYLMDEVLAMRVERDAEGNNQRALMCDSDGLWSAKDRSGRLDAWEMPDMGHIINKIKGGES